MLPYSHYTAAVKIPSKHPIGFVSRRRQKGLPMTLLDNDTLHKSAHFCIMFYLLYIVINILSDAVKFIYFFYHLNN